MIIEKYKSLFEKLEVYIFSFRDNIESFNLDIYGHKIKDENIFDCTQTSSENFYLLLRQMDKLTFGDQGMAMDGWMYFDCSAMPGAIIGFGLNQETLPNELKSKLEIPKDYKGIIPISMFIAIPMLGNKWFGHNLSSLKSILGNDYAGLGLLTKLIGIHALKIKTLYGATQWGSAAIHIHAKLAPMELVTSRTPVHTHPNSLCYKSIYQEDEFLNILHGKENKREKEDFLLEKDDIKKQSEIQNLIESGKTYTITNQPVHKDGEVFYKIKKS